MALGFIATAAKTGVASYMFGLILLPTLAFAGLAAFHRVLQSGNEDLGYARRIAHLIRRSQVRQAMIAGRSPLSVDQLAKPQVVPGGWFAWSPVGGAGHRIP